MAHPILKNIHLSCIQELNAPSGASVSIHPGEYVVGEYFLHLVKPGFFEVVEEDITSIEPGLIKYEQR
jgi:hypothetical protein